MWTKSAVQFHELVYASFALIRNSLTFLTALVFCLIFVFLVVPPLHAEEIISVVTLNREVKGEFFVIMQDDGNFFIAAADLKQMGLRELPEKRIIVDGGEYISIKEIRDISFSFDESNLTLEIIVSPEMLGKNTLNLASGRRDTVYYPHENSFFLNYGIDYTTGGESSFYYQGTNMTHEFGLRLADGLFVSDGIYSQTREETNDGLVRLNTRYIYDEQDNLRRFIMGDFTSVSGDLGGRVQMGGLSYSKVYQIDPYFINYPLFNFSGVLTFPSELDLYVDGVKIRTERFAPGEFQLSNFQGISGAQNVDIVIRDSLGREQHIAMPIYGTALVLQQGLHEYSYNLGFLRRNFGVESNDYDKNLVFSAYHRYGMTDLITLGGNAELHHDLGNLGGELAVVNKRYGLSRVQAAVSSWHGDSGAAGQVTHEFRTQNFNINLGVQAYSKKYRTLADLEDAFDRKRSLIVNCGYLTQDLGSFGVSFRDTRYYEEQNRKELTFTWSRQLYKRAYLNSSISFVDEDDKYVSGTVNLNWHFDRDHTVSAGYQREDDSTSNSLEISKNTPIGLGTGYQLRAERIEEDSSSIEQIAGFIQHNSRFASLRTDVVTAQTDKGTTNTAKFGLSGAMVYVGKTFGLTRPVRDSFAVVSTGGVEGVQVYANGQVSGRTNQKGRLIVPDLSSYFENDLSFENKDIPLDYLMPQVRLTVSPPLRGGSCINFPVSRYQAFTGTLLIKTKEEATPLVDAELALATPSGSLTFWTGSDGEFYLDSQLREFDILAAQGCAGAAQESTKLLPAGSYPLTIKYAGETFLTELNIPETDENYTELGTIILPARPDAPAPDAPAPDAPAPDAPAPDKEDTHLPTPQPSTVEMAPVPPVALAAGEPDRTSSPSPGAPHLETELPGPGEEHDHATPQYVVHFPLDSHVPVVSDQTVLEQAARYLAEHPELPIEIEGHTCQLGSAAHNQELGQRRARAIQAYLEQVGIDPARFVRIVSYGSHRLACRGQGEDCLRQNRRAVIMVVITPE